MSRWSSLAAAGTALLAAVAGAAAAGSYHIVPKSSFARGCFPPCLCPVMYTSDVSGTFCLDPLSITGTLDVYEVTDVRWSVFPDEPLSITGSGTYQVFSEFAVLHRLELDLVVGDEPVEHFDSGWVVATEPFPAIDITISINGMYCWDTVMDLSAEPVSGDIDGDGAVTVDDIMGLLLEWGPCPPDAPCMGDMDCDGEVETDDLLELLLHWG
jgi:hypothetical protein